MTFWATSDLLGLLGLLGNLVGNYYWATSERPLANTWVPFWVNLGQFSGCPLGDHFGQPQENLYW